MPHMPRPIARPVLPFALPGFAIEEVRIEEATLVIPARYRSDTALP